MGGRGNIDKDGNRLGIIYKLTAPDGKVYIGQTICKLGKRITRHKKNARDGSNSKLSKHIRKFGMESFDKEILCESILFGPDLNEAEENAINVHNSFENGLNHSSNGQGMSGPLSKETIEKLSEATKKMWEDPKKKEKIMKGIKDSSQSEEMREKRREIAIEMWKDPEFRERVSNSIGEARRKKESREKSSKQMEEKWSDPKYKERVSKSMKEACENEELIEKRAKGILGNKNSNKNKYRGVYWNKAFLKWEVKINKSKHFGPKKTLFLGYFKSEFEAVKIYNAKIIELFDEDDPRLNKIEEEEK